MSSHKYNHILGLSRMLLATYIFLFHLIPRYAFYGYDVQPWLDLQLLLIKLFQSSNETNPAVIAFLVISGYCIHKNGVLQPSFQVKEFYLRRFWRIAPLYILGIILGATVIYYLQHDQQIAIIANTPHFSFSSLLYKTLGLFAFIPWQFEAIAHQGNGPLITCAVEIWLYIFYPFLALWVSKYGTKKFLLVLLMITAIGSFLATIFPEISSWWHNGAFLGFLLYWWLGAFAAQNAIKLPKFNLLLLFYLSAATILILFPNTILLVEIRKILFAISVAYLVQRSANAKPSDSKHSMLALITTPSFSLYALHLPLICLALYLNLPMYMTIITILVLAYASYFLIERPAINFGKQLVASKWRRAYA